MTGSVVSVVRRHFFTKPRGCKARSPPVPPRGLSRRASARIAPFSRTPFDARIAVLSFYPQGGAGRRGGHQPQADGARGADPASRRGDLHVAAPRAARGPEG